MNIQRREQLTAQFIGSWSDPQMTESASPATPLLIGITIQLIHHNHMYTLSHSAIANCTYLLGSWLFPVNPMSASLSED